jgi:SAM-dependent methyltransferase
MLTESQLLKLMVDTHGVRFDGRIWDAFDEEIVPALPAEPSIVDLGCGPGLFLFDIFQRLQGCRLYGVDSSEVMLEVAGGLGWSATKPRLKLCSLSETIPLESTSMDVVAMNFFLHQFDYPLPLLKEALRILKPGGFIWLYDWARRPLAEYLAFWEIDPELYGPTALSSSSEAKDRMQLDEGLLYRLFSSHNRFTRQDWQHVLSLAGLKIIHEVARARGQHVLLLLKRASEVRSG